MRSCRDAQPPSSPLTRKKSVPSPPARYLGTVATGKSEQVLSFETILKILPVKFCLFFYVKVCKNFGTSGTKTMVNGSDTGNFYVKKQAKLDRKYFQNGLKTQNLFGFTRCYGTVHK